MPKKNIIRNRSFNFALAIIKLNQKLVKQNEYVISRQLLKSGTSIGANVEEAGAAQSKKDFVAKMAIASKEARETKYWLRLLKHSNLLKFNASPYLKEINEIIKILTAIVKTSQQVDKR
ncbi:four helix bundle protein [Fodinibius sp.]|uniref:four helix bundle protein n=1 Tax=Fodinibius sp. TaxID=1872440 RepID=UPI002ACD96D5|nr:four helix bundle protein [Fodinibius sp.]MDZ7657658.1 four helix bundle protein [Fodinibius sp.]